jgi:predicted NACHT family NTPase
LFGFKYKRIRLLTIMFHDPIQEYRQKLTTMIPPFLLARRFTAAESWSKATTQEGTRYVGLFREHEPDFATILTHPRLLILGEPGAGKSTTGRALIKHIQEHGQPADIAVVASLKSYTGNLRNLLLENTPAIVLDAPALHRTYVLDGVDEVPVPHRHTLRADIQRLMSNDGTARIICTARQAFYAQHHEAFPDGVAVFHLLDFDDDDIRACTIQRNVNPDAFLTAAREADCAQELRNPFVLDAMLTQ